MKHIPIPQNLLREYLAYDESVPSCFVWKKKPNRRIKIGAPVSYKGSGYGALNLLGTSYCLHRAIWCYHYGDPGSFEIDHIDRDKSNNKVSNLRLATRPQNIINRPGQNPDKGVRFRCGKWDAKCRGIYLGRFESKADAQAAYQQKAKELYGEFAFVN